MIYSALAMLETDEQRNTLSEFYEQNSNRFFLIALSKLHNTEEAEEAVQEAFVRIAEKPQKFFSIEHNKRLAYIDVIIRNISIDMFKKKCCVETSELTDEISHELIDLSLEDNVLGKISHDELKKYISGLPQLWRDTITSSCVVGLSNKEIAAQLNISEVAVRQRLHLARNAIKEFVCNKEQLL